MANSKKSGSSILGKYWLLLFTLGVVVVFGIISPSFLSVTNLLNILSSACMVGMMGIGLTCIFATGELDFSAGAQVSLSCCLIIMETAVSTQSSRMVTLL